MRTRKPKIDTTLRIFEDYKELWEQYASEYYVFPVFNGMQIQGYRITIVEDAEEEYRYWANYFISKGITTEKQILDRYKWPLWFAIEIIIRQKENIQTGLF